MNYNREQIAKLAKRYFKLLSSVNRPRIKKLIKWLQDPDTGFIDAPASRSPERHHCYPGGLIDHSLGMYDILKELIKKYKLNIPGESIIIISLLHDICKAETYGYIEGSEYKKDDKYPIGHGDKSIIMVQQYIKLTMDEIMAIRWHMGPFDPAYMLYQRDIELAGCNKLVAATFSADYIAAQLM